MFENDDTCCINTGWFKYNLNTNTFITQSQKNILNSERSKETIGFAMSVLFFVCTSISVGNNVPFFSCRVVFG